jgi:hypothetical protein
MNNEKKISVFFYPWTGLRAGILLALLICPHARADELDEKCDAYFSKMFENFSAISKSTVVKKTRLTAIDRHFVNVLKRNQTFQSLIRTNSKGIIISEVTRGKTPGRNYRNIARQPWFLYIVRNTRAYHGFFEEGGRYYLFWAEPVIITTSSGKNKFNGAVAVKIDLWDSFHFLAKSVDQPFIVRMNGKSLYSNRWRQEFVPVEKKLDIPGIDRISIFYEDGGDSAGFSPGDSTLINEITAGDIRSTQDTGAEPAEKPVFTFNAENYLYVIIASAALVIILLVALTRLLVWVKYKRLENRIDREDII